MYVVQHMIAYRVSLGVLKLEENYRDSSKVNCLDWSRSLHIPKSRIVSEYCISMLLVITDVYYIYFMLATLFKYTIKKEIGNIFVVLSNM